MADNSAEARRVDASVGRFHPASVAHRHCCGSTPRTTLVSRELVLWNSFGVSFLTDTCHARVVRAARGHSVRIVCKRGGEHSRRNMASLCPVAFSHTKQGRWLSTLRCLRYKRLHSVRFRRPTIPHLRLALRTRASTHSTRHLRCVLLLSHGVTIQVSVSYCVGEVISHGLPSFPYAPWAAIHLSDGICPDSSFLKPWLPTTRRAAHDHILEGPHASSNVFFNCARWRLERSGKCDVLHPLRQKSPSHPRHEPQAFLCFRDTPPN